MKRPAAAEPFHIRPKPIRCTCEALVKWDSKKRGYDCRKCGRFYPHSAPVTGTAKR